MKAVWYLTLKNLRLLVRARMSALIVIFAPLLIILVLGLSYNTSSNYGLNIGVYSSSFTEEVNSFIKVLQEEEFRIITYNDVEECVDDIKLGAVHTCIEVPESFAVDGNQQKEIVYHLDPSKINLVYMIQETLKTKFNVKSQEISQDIAGNILTKLSTTKNVIVEKNAVLGSAKEKSSSALSASESTKTSLAGLDLVLPTYNYNYSLVTDVVQTIGEAQSKITKAIAVIDASTLNSTEKTSIKSTLSGANGNLSAASSTLNGPGTETVENLISSLRGNLDLLKSKLSAASDGITSATSSLGTTTSSLTEVTSSLETVMAALTSAEADLNSLSVTNPDVVSSPIKTTVKKVGKEGTYLNYLFPALLVLVVMFASLLLGTTLVMMEKNSPAFLRNFFLPLKKATFITATYLTTLILIIIQLIIILGVSMIFLDVSGFGLVFFILLVAASIFAFLGMAVGYIFTSEETGVLASISLGSILLFVSGVILPLESVSPFLREITYFNPFVIAEKLIREVFIFQSPFSAIWMDLLTLISYCVVMFLVILIAESLMHKNLIHRFMHHHHLKHRQEQKQVKAGGILR
ncbi:ABC transporter permease [Candidatus Woesearchaeota archaeon]|nr:ABC transporter permease [Candidatus Woesearchaeota archaeon]